MALICGNTYIMKVWEDANAMIVSVYDRQPSERDPTACMALVELLKEAGEEKFQMQFQLVGETLRVPFQAALMEW